MEKNLEKRFAEVDDSLEYLLVETMKIVRARQRNSSVAPEFLEHHAELMAYTVEKVEKLREHYAAIDDKAAPPARRLRYLINYRITKLQYCDMLYHNKKRSANPTIKPHPYPNGFYRYNLSKPVFDPKVRHRK